MGETVNQQSIGPRRARRLADELLRWFAVHARDLPWRHTRDPYAIWVSEVMLQQTRVEVVRGRWERFLRRFPTLASLAGAAQSEVLAEWAGLGYYRRARSLHEAAERIVDLHGGALPTDSASLRLLPGFGAYTAGAVASIAFGERAVAIDGNVERVIARLLMLDQDPSRGPAQREVVRLARALLEGSDPAALNQALMELGATVCTPRSPRCDACPWHSSCRARAAGVAENYPRRTPRKASVEVASYAAVVRRSGTHLYRRRPEGEPNAGLWELPTTPWHPGSPEPDAGRDALEDLGRLLERNWQVGDAVVSVRHGITHHRITVVGHEVLDDDAAGLPEGLRWGSPDQASTWGLSAATVKLLARLPALL